MNSWQKSTYLLVFFIITERMREFADNPDFVSASTLFGWFLVTVYLAFDYIRISKKPEQE